MTTTPYPSAGLERAMVEMQWSRDDQVATITIMRPKVRNALDFDTLEAVGQAFAAADLLP